MAAAQDEPTRPPAEPVRAERTLDGPAIIEALTQVLDSATFAGAPRSRDLLGFVVTETLAGRGHLLNERVLSRLALGRPPTVDTRTDASARVQAGRTRDLLDRYYAEEGRRDRLRISIPVGQYGAAFSEHHDDDTLSDLTRAGLATGEPVLAVVALRARPTGIERRVAARLTESIVQTLARFPGLQVVGPVAGGPPKSVESVESVESVVAAVGTRTGADQVLHGGVRASDDAVRVTVHLANAATGATAWSETFERPIDAFNGFDAEDDILGYIVAAVGDFSGFVLRDPAPARAHGSHGEVALALSQYYAYLDELTPSLTVDVIAALESAITLEPDNAHLNASLGFIHAVGDLMLGAAAAEHLAGRLL